MKRRSYVFIFVVAVLVGIAGSLVKVRLTERARTTPPAIDQLTARVGVCGQIFDSDVPAIRALGYKLVVALRPDGEAEAQPSAVEIRRAAHRQGMEFAYVPVPHGDIPEMCVQSLKELLNAHVNHRVLLYCRTGRRAARTWGLAEADSLHGLEGRQILSAIEQCGQNADDLTAAIERRVASRPRQ